MDKLIYLIRYILNRMLFRFKSIGFPVAFESSVGIFNPQFITLGSNIFIGKNVIIQIPEEYKNTNYKPNLIIQDKVTIGMGSWINALDKVEIQKNVLIGPNVYIADHMHKYTDVKVPIRYQGLDKIKPVTIKEDAWICANSVINPGVTIGKHAIIGANSVVSQNVPDYSIAVGAPARIIKKYNFHSEKWEKVI